MNKYRLNLGQPEAQEFFAKGSELPPQFKSKRSKTSRRPAGGSLLNHVKSALKGPCLALVSVQYAAFRFP
jgi:hypothetical protein